MNFILAVKYDTNKHKENNMPAKKKVTSTKTANKIWGLTRISLGLIFIWAFLDKTFGLGFATCRNTKTEVVDMMCSTAWVNGGSPTY